MNSNEIAEIYRNKLVSLGIDNVAVRIIHKNKDIVLIQI